MRPIAPISVLFALLVPLVSALPRPARAEEAAEAWKIPYQQCLDQIREGNYPSALKACEQAYALKKEQVILMHMVRIHTALLHPVQARDALRLYLSGPLDEASRKTADAQLRYLDTQIATLVITTRFEGAEIRVDDQVIDPIPLARGVDLPIGAHIVTLQASGSPFTRSVFLHGGERKQLELPGSGSIVLRCAVPQVRFFIDGHELDAAQAASGTPQAAGNHRVTFKAGATAWPEQPVTVSPDERSSVVCSTPIAARASMNPRGYWVTGTGLAVGVAAIATAVYNGHQYDKWQTANDSLRNTTLPFEQQQSIAQDNDQLMQSIQTTRKVAIGLGVASALVTAGGVALLFKDSAASERNRASSWFRQVAAGVTVNGALTAGEIAWRSAW